MSILVFHRSMYSMSFHSFSCSWQKKTTNILCLYEHDLSFITDRVRSTREGYVLTHVCPSIHPSVCWYPPARSSQGQGTPARSRWGGGGGSPARSSWGGGVTHLARGGTLARSRQGVPRGTHQPGMGYPMAGVQPPSPQHGVLPPPSTGQQMEYLIHRGRYASCVHAWGHSCINHILMVHLFSSRGAREQPEIREAESSTQGVRYTF